MSFQTESDKHASSELSEYLLPPSTSIEPDVEERQVFLDEEILPQGATVGERQPPQFRDPGFAVAFLMQLMMVLVLAFYWGFPTLASSTTSYSASSSSSQEKRTYKSDGDSVNIVGWMYVLLLSGVVAIAMSALGLYLIARYAKQLIQISVAIHLIGSLILMLQFLVQHLFVPAVIMLAIFLGVALYFWSIQGKINFSASNLVTASEAIRSNLGILVVAFSMASVSFVWSVLWVVAFNGARVKTSHCDEFDSSSKQCISTHYNTLVMAMLLLSFYWTQQVILNIVNVTVAGFVATFWFAPEEASSFCSPSIMDSWKRASTTSLGSIAFGSLLVALFQWIHDFVRYIRRHRGEGIFSCLAEFCATILEQLVEYFNKWAFVYIGVYGYSYLESGHKVMDLFRQRGWTYIINDQLTYNVLSMMVVAVGFAAAGVMVGLVAVVPSLVGGLKETSQTAWIVAVIALVMGVVVASVTMRIVASAVDTVVVCFAEAPNDFRRHHPQLHQNMVEAWSSTYPNEFGMV